ncbi:MAG: hypothetical protein ACHQRJ_03750 [Alphaproteobacteria bacterium]
MARGKTAKTKKAKPAKRPAARVILLNRRELARALRVSEPTIDAWIARGCPVAARGLNGVAYRFDAEKVLAWRTAERRQDAAESGERREFISQLQLRLEGGEGEGEKMSPKDQKVLWEAVAARMKAAQMRGEFCLATDVEAEREETFKELAAALQSLPEQLADECGLAIEAAAHLRSKIDDFQEMLRRRFAEPSDKGVSDAA